MADRQNNVQLKVVVGGVDTHGETHHAAVVDEIGRHLADHEFEASPAGYRRLLAWLRDFGRLDRVGVDGRIEAIRTLRVTRRSAVKARTQAINQLRALLITGPAELREQLRGLPTTALITACTRLRPGTDLAHPGHATKAALRRLARRYRQLHAEISELDTELAVLVAAARQKLGRRPCTRNRQQSLLCRPASPPKGNHRQGVLGTDC